VFWTVSLSITRSLALYTQRQVYVIQGIRTIPLASSQHDGHRKCPKHVEFYPKNKFEKLVHILGFITRIYHDAQSSVNVKIMHTYQIKLTVKM